MKRKYFKKMAAAIVACVMVFSTNIVAFAAYKEAGGYAGSTWIEAEVGFSGKNAYAKVTAMDYVDADMQGTVLFHSGKGSIQKSFSQKTYDEFSASYSGNVYFVDCEFDIVSNDGGKWSDVIWCE